jgi:hypothetical protein
MFMLFCLRATPAASAWGEKEEGHQAADVQLSKGEEARRIPPGEAVYLFISNQFSPYYVDPFT